MAASHRHRQSPRDLCRSKLGPAAEACYGPDAIRAEVTDWETASLGPEFELARHVLLHEDGIVLDQLPGLIADGIITPDQINDWPLFDRMRAEGQLHHVLAVGGHA
jgi:hypothetical protein